MNAKVAKSLRGKAEQFARENKADKNQAYQMLKKIYLENSPKENKKIGL